MKHSIFVGCKDMNFFVSRTLPGRGGSAEEASDGLRAAGRRKPDDRETARGS